MIKKQEQPELLQIPSLISGNKNQITDHPVSQDSKKTRSDETPEGNINEVASGETIVIRNRV